MFRIYLRITRVCDVTFLLTFGITKYCSNGIKSRHHVLCHFSHADIFHRFEGFIAGTICLFLIARVTNSNGRVPVSVGHAFCFWRALRAKALSTITTMMFVICWTEWNFTLITVFYLIVRSPIRRCHLIRGPGFQCFRRLQRDIRHGFSDVWNAINNSLCCVLSNYRTIWLKENMEYWKAISYWNKNV